jgi:hypothetical protein
MRLALAIVSDVASAAAALVLVANHAVAQSVEVTVRSAAELRQALEPGQGARTIRLQAGRYVLDAPLVVPDGVVLLGEGVMRTDPDGLPTGFAPGAETVLVASERLQGDVVTLGDRTRLQNLRVESPAASADEPRAGNLVVIASRRAGDRLNATLSECEFINHTQVGFSLAGPTGHTIAVLTRNPGAGVPWHEGARVRLAIERSLVRRPTGIGSVFALNFASAASIELDFERSRFEGSMGIVGGVARPDPVHGASTVLRSRGNLYVKGGGTYPTGWGILGASVAPHAGVGGGGAESNSVRVDSQDDRIEGYRVGIHAAAGRVVAARPGTVMHNRGEVTLRGIRIRSVGEGAADLSLHGALSESESGNETRPDAPMNAQGNVLRVSIQGSTGSGPRRNVYANAWLSGDADTAGRNRLEFAGSRAAFLESNADFTPAPDARHFLTPTDDR